MHVCAKIAAVSLASCVLASRCQLSKVSHDLNSFLMLRDKSKSETRWFALDQVIVTRNVCMQGDRWWSLDMTGSDASIRRAHCDSDKLPLLICRQTGQTFASNSTVKSNIPTGVLPFSKSHGDGLVEEEPYKRCRAAYAEGMPCTLTKTCRENRKKHKPSYIRHQHA